MLGLQFNAEPEEARMIAKLFDGKRITRQRLSAC